MRYIFLLFGFFLSRANGTTCDKWLSNLKIKDQSNCEFICRTAEVDLATFSCNTQCEKLCKKLTQNDDNPSLLKYYGLTPDEIIFCEANQVDCLKAYKLSWNAEQLCLTIYSSSRTNNESDACRHFVWAMLLDRDLGTKTAETVLSAHENYPLNPVAEKQMDTANNKLGLLVSQKLNKNNYTDDQIIDSFKEQLKNKKLIILKPSYSNSGGLP